MDNKDKLEEMMVIAACNRRTGYTYMMLRAAMIKPNCIIISSNKRTSEYVERQYDILYEATFKPKSIKNKIIIKLLIFVGVLSKPKIKPRFLTLDSNIRGYNLPILFDNSCFFR